MSGLVGIVAQQAPRLDPEGHGEGLKGGDFDPLQRRPREDAGGGRLRQARERGELVGIGEAAFGHVAVEVPVNHTDKVALLLSLDKRERQRYHSAMPRQFIDAPQGSRCTATVSLRDGTTAQCGRHAKVGTLCTQHAKMATDEMRGAVERNEQRIATYGGRYGEPAHD